MKATIMNNKEKWGHYFVVRVGDLVRDEWTNIGVIVCDESGDRIGQKFDNWDRAIIRGDSHGLEEWVIPGDHFSNLNKSQLEEITTGTGHAMSSIQSTEPRGTLIYKGMVDDIFKSFVAAKE